MKKESKDEGEGKIEWMSEREKHDEIAYQVSLEPLANQLDELCD